MERPEFICLGEEDVFVVTKRKNEIVFGTEKPDCLREFAVLPETAITDYQDKAYSIFAKREACRKNLNSMDTAFRKMGRIYFGDAHS